jgi:hypothetical protein
MINITQDIYTKLSTTSAITTLAGSPPNDRIWGDRSTPPKLYRPELGAAIAFQLRGGLPQYDARILTVSYKFKIYGSTASASISPQTSAFNLYSAVYDALQDAVFGDLRYSGAELLPQMLEEFALNWPYALGFFEFVAING